MMALALDRHQTLKDVELSTFVVHTKKAVVERAVVGVAMTM